MGFPLAPLARHALSFSAVTRDRHAGRGPKGSPVQNGTDQEIVILLVEDNAGDVFLVREALEAAGFPHVLHVVNEGTAAMDFLRGQASSGGLLPDLVILDLNLPGKNGRQVMAEMEATPGLKDLPVAVLSTSRGERDIGREFQQLRSTFAAKTPSFQQLVEIIKEFKEFATKPA